MQIFVRAAALTVFGLVLVAGAIPGAIAGKDAGPINAACDQLDKSSLAWRGCAKTLAASMSDSELFYAGYWLAKTGQYAQALDTLTRISDKTPRVLTYIGFATRKAGDVDGALPFYAKALAADPNFVVARAYLGEAYLTKREPAKAKAELAEIASRCGTTCAAYTELATEITAFETKRG